jgi:predicted RND superfamily exporter protein
MAKARTGETMEALVRFTIKIRWFLLPLIVASVAFFGYYARRHKINNSINVWFVKDDPNLKAYERFQECFGNDEFVAIALRDKETVFIPANLRLIKELTNHIAAADHISEVISLASALYISAEGDELRIRKTITTPPQTVEEAAEIRRMVYETPIHVGNIVSKDGKMTLILARLEATVKIDEERDAIIASLKKIIAADFEKYGKSYHLGGIPILYNTLNQISINEVKVFTVLSALVILVFLVLALRRAISVVLALAVMFFSVTLLMGFYYFSGKTLNMVTMMLPTLIMIIGIADTIHIIINYDQDRERHADLDRKTLIIKSVGFIGIPCLFTSITTAIGFLSLYSAKIGAIKEFGLFFCIGIMIAYAISIALCVLGLYFFKIPAGGSRKKESRIIQPILDRLGRFVIAHRRTIAVAALLICLFCIVGIFQIEIDTFSMKLLKKSNPYRRDNDLIEENFGYFTPLEFTVRVPSRDGIKSPALLRRIEEFQWRMVEEEPQVSKSLGLVDIIKRLNQVLTDGSRKNYIVPKDRRKVSQSLLLYEMHPDNDLHKFVDACYTYTRITSRVKMMSAGDIRAVIGRAKEKARNLFGKEAEPREAGYLPLYVAMIDYILLGQISSFALAFVVIFLLIGLLFRSFKFLLIGILPNIFPIFLILGLMGWMGISLDIATVTITSIAIGIAVDDTIHFLFKFRKELGKTPGDCETAVSNTIRTTGRAIVITSLILVFGFCIFLLASIKSIIHFGLLTGVAMLAALAGDLLILPVILLKVRPRT